MTFSFASRRATRPSFIINTLAIAAFALGGCTLKDTLNCEPGLVERDDECVRVDAGIQDSGVDAAPDAQDGASPDTPDGAMPDTNDGGPDGGPDAGPCGECGAERPLCNTTTLECVQCLTPTDCAGMGDNVMCSTSGTCVACLDSTDCETPGASVCGTEGITAGSCAACTAGSATDCAGIMDGAAPLNVCDDSGAAGPGSGVCVECTPATEERDCGDNACDPATLRCTGTARESQGVCRACRSDSECQSGLACVPMMFRGGALPGGYCMTIATLDPCEQPYSTLLEGRATLSGVRDAAYCGILETLARCEAVVALVDNAMCPGGMDSECPGEGLCRRVGQSISTGIGGLDNRCTYECDSPLQCPNVASQDTCGTGYMPMPEDDSFCGGGRP